jgi:hypothetical protein
MDLGFSLDTYGFGLNNFQVTAAAQRQGCLLVEPVPAEAGIHI